VFIKMEKRRLNADIGGSIAKFQSAIKSFEHKAKIYRTILKGKGLEFSGYRQYSGEDDASTIDWKASKRANQFLVKQYIEEENLKVVFLIDIGEDMVFGSGNKLKCEYSAEIIAALTKLIINSRNKVGYIFFNDTVREYIRPARGDNHFGRFMDVLTDASIYGGTSNLSSALDFSLMYLDKSISSLVIVSDFVKMDPSVEEKLALVAKKFETMAVMVRDPLDRNMPDISGEFVVEDSATGQRMLINPSLAKKTYEKYALEQELFVREVFRESGIDMIELLTDKPFVASLAAFIKGRVKSVKRNTFF